ncbi:MAG: nucleoside hydrolase [Nitrospirae bacterium]|nr:nucleoside hydrolase [Nitrospirota bacterium]
MLKKIIIDTDAKNEIDDQYAITYAALSESFEIRGLTAAHFGKKGSMEKSYDEVLFVLKLLGMEGRYPVLRGAEKALANAAAPADSPAARFIIEEALKNSGAPLYIVCIGAITNLASAYLIEPKIKEKIKALWLAGRKWPEGGFCFNDENDILSAQVIFDSDIDLTLVPVCGPACKLKIYKSDKQRIKGKGEIGNYLWKLFMMRRFGFPKPVYDVAAIAALKSPEWCAQITAKRPAILENGKFDHSDTKGTMTVITDIDAESIKKDFLDSLDTAR